MAELKLADIILSMKEL